MYIRTELNIFIFLFVICIALNSAAQDTILPKDTALSKIDSLALLQKDSSFTKIDTLGIDSIKASIKSTSDNAIDAPVYYHSKDSMMFAINEQKLYLYGSAVVVSEEIELGAEYIEIDLGNNLVYAKGITDSVGNEIGRPVFKDGDDVFEADTMKYNFTTKKGIIKGVITEQSGGYLHSDRTKMHPNKEIHLDKGKYTTCDKKHPHYYIRLTKAKVIPNDKIISGPAYIVIEDIPLPIGIPFGFFPNQSGQTSGVLIPEYGEDKNRGFYLRNGGYYFAFGDYVDLNLKADIYTQGSWGSSLHSNYKKRYKFQGNLDVKYDNIIVGEKDLFGYLKTQTFWVKWLHQQDPKARPNSSFSANVNLGSSTYYKYDAYQTDPNNYLSNTKQSSITYSKIWPNSPFRFSGNLRHSQNSIDSTVSLSLTEMNLTMNRIFPFKRKTRVGKTKFYEKIGISYNSNLKNIINTKESTLFTESSLSEFKNGIKHSIPVSTSLKVFKSFTINPSFNYTERWYSNYLNKYWDENLYINDSTYGGVVIDTISGFKRAGDYTIRAALTTKLYGMYQFSPKFIRDRIKALRHIVTPSVSFSYRPDFSEDKWGYYKEYQTDTSGNTGQYSIFDDGIYGKPPAGKSGMINFSISNNLEMKVRNLKDTVTQIKKIVLIENLTLSSSYNIAADSLNWSKIRISGRTKLFKRLDIRYSCNLDPYILDSTGTYNLNKFEWDENNRLARIQNSDWNFSLNFNLGSEYFTKKNQDNTQETTTGDVGGQAEQETEIINKNNAYIDFSMPWSLNISYVLQYPNTYYYSNMKAKPDSISNEIIQSIGFSGEVNLTPKWKIGFSSGYDYVNKEFTYTTVNIYRDLHCWEMSFNWIPFGFRQSYNFTIRIKSTILRDFKYEKKQDWSESF